MPPNYEPEQLRLKRRRKKVARSFRYFDHQKLFDKWYDRESKRLKITDIQRHSKVLTESRGVTLSQVRSICTGRVCD